MIKPAFALCRIMMNPPVSADSSFSRVLKNKNQFAGQGVRRYDKRSIFKPM
ncbi:MAG: hypothetical protein PHD57_09415 [Desulfobacterales bacterium]|nr:hypothetical protein [Desulfobacterales bacterium]MDD3951692.1 hypothetical protein [Desulfobacterales bacterium]